MAHKFEKSAWLGILIDTLDELNGRSHYDDIYKVAKRIREERGGTITRHYRATIRRTMEDNSEDSANFKGRKIFRGTDSYNNPMGLSRGTWTLNDNFRSKSSSPTIDTEKDQIQIENYQAGVEGIAKEYIYLRKSRNQNLVDLRRRKDDFTCQACGYRNLIGGAIPIIDVHHLNPLGVEAGEVVTSIDDLICLCPNCHRIAHSGKDFPLSIKQIVDLLGSVDT